MARLVCRLAVLAVVGLSAAAPAAAFSVTEEQERQPGEAARDLALESIEKLMQAMELLLESIPQYEPPVINEDGDIIIRRKRDDEAPPPDEDAPAPEQKDI